MVSSANMEPELMRQCTDRALVLDHRVSKFSVQLGEWPGDVAKLLDVLSREDVRWVPVGPVDLIWSTFDAIFNWLPSLFLLSDCWTSVIEDTETDQISSRQR